MMQRVIKKWRCPSDFTMPSGYFTMNSIGSGRRYMKIDCATLREAAFSLFGFHDIYDEPYYENFIGNHFEDGAFVHSHRDPVANGFMHVRVNWMLKKPDSGGNPIIDGKEIDVDEGDLWICYSSEEVHSSVPIAGGQRIICSFGAVIKKPECFDIAKVFV